MGLKPDVEKMEAEKDVKRLLRTLKYDEDDDVRYRAAEALRKIGWQPKNDDEKALYDKFLVKKKEWNESAKFEKPAAEPFVQGRIDEKFESLIQNFKEECKCKYEPPALSGEIPLFPENKIKNTFVEMGESIIEKMIHLLKCEDLYLQAGAAEVLGEIGNKKAVKHLIEVFRSSNYSLTQYMAAFALVKIEGISIEEPLKNSIVDELISAIEEGVFVSHYAREKATWALGEIRSQRACEFLCELSLGNKVDPILLIDVTESLKKYFP